MKKSHFYLIIAGACALVSMPAFLYARDFSQAIAVADDLAVQGIITPRSDANGYKLDKTIPLKELAAIATNVRKTQGGTGTTFNADEAGKDWSQSILSKAQKLTLISGDSSKTGESLVTRAETYAMIMRAVCMATLDESLMDHDDWTRFVYDEAFKYGLTGVSWSDFNPESTVLRQEVFFIVSNALEWSNKTGGCHPITLSSAEDEKIQEPGTFMRRFITVTDDIYSFIVLSSTTPADIKKQFMRSINISQDQSESVVIRDQDGVAIVSNDILSRGTLVYAYFTRFVPDTASDSAEDQIAFGQQPGTFVKRFETTSENIYSYIVKSGGNSVAVRQRALQAFSLPSYVSPLINIRDEDGEDIEKSLQLTAGQLVYVYIQK